MKAAEIREITDVKELLEKLQAEKDGLVRMKLDHAISRIEQPYKIKEARKTIARLKTELRQRELKK